MYFTTPQFWWLTAAGLAIAEVFVPGTILIFLAASAACTAVLASIGMSIVSLQVAVFTALSAVFLFFMRPIWMRFAMGKDEKTGVDAMIGKEAKVIQTIDKGQGRVKMGADSFPARSEENRRIAEGSYVTVKRIEGITLIVDEIQQ